MSIAYHLRCGKCTETPQAKFKSLNNYQQMKTDFYAIDMLKGIKASIYKFESTRYRFASLY